jgi:hypothetical protein
MSKYYNINGLKVRVSDHEPNHAMNKFRGENDVEFYTKSIDNRTLSIESQVYGYCDKHDLDMSLFAEVLVDFPDAEPVFAEVTKSTTQVVTQAFIDAYNAIGKKRRQHRRIELCETFGFCWNEVRFGNYIVK